MNALKKFLTISREKVIIAVAVFCCGIMIGLGVLWRNMGDSEEYRPPPPVNRVEMERQVQNDIGGGERSEKKVETSSYFLKPSAEELMTQLSEMENLTDEVVEERLTSLRVLWPVYFFSLEKNGADSYQLLCDVDESGFGVMVTGVVSLEKYPKLKELSPGDSLWMGGEIALVDREGTGTVYLTVEQISLGDKLPTVEVSTEPAPVESPGDSSKQP